jgi:tetratricopeptide (TPR) repeat protein
MGKAVLAAALLAPALARGQLSTPVDAVRQEGDRTAPPALLAELDAAYARRDAPGEMDGMARMLEDAEKRWPGDYEVHWRIARHHFWLADDPTLDKREKSRLGRIAWEYGDRAAAVNPDRVEGWHFAAAGVGNHALGMGVLAALRQGIEGSFRERLSRAEQLDPGFQDGAIPTAWGRFWYELPWPKYSARRSRAALEEALRQNPDNVRARVYLAELNLKEGDRARAREELENALTKPPGRYDAPEERRWQMVARGILAAVEDR